MALALAADGGRVMVADLSEQHNQETARPIEQASS
jgi:hypothetical protein